MEQFLERINGIWTPHPGQKAFLLANEKVRVLACGRRWGKTDACAIQVIERLLSGLPGRQLLVAPTLAQVRILFERVVDLLERLVEPLALGPAHCRLSPYPVLTYEDRTVMGRSAAVPRTLRGLEANGIVVDEAAFVDDRVVTDVLWPMLATTDGTMTLISTPNGFNGFWRMFLQGQHGGGGVWSRRSPSQENSRVSERFLASQKELLSDRAFRVEYQAEFLDTLGAVFRQAVLDRALVPSAEIQGGPPYTIGVDWAKCLDYTAIVVLSGTRERAELVYLEQFQGEWQTQVERVLALLEVWPPGRVLCDATGPGSMPSDSLRSAAPRLQILPFDFTKKSKPALIESLVELFERDGLRMAPHPGLLRQLQEFHAKETPSGHVRYEGSGAHDDLVCALALAAYGLTSSYSVRIQIGGSRESPRRS